MDGCGRADVVYVYGFRVDVNMAYAPKSSFGPKKMVDQGKQLGEYSALKRANVCEMRARRTQVAFRSFL